MWEILYIVITEVPEQRPYISGIPHSNAHYHVGSIVRANCTSRNSKPAANLTWAINSKPVSFFSFQLFFSLFFALFGSSVFLPFFCPRHSLALSRIGIEYRTRTEISFEYTYIWYRCNRRQSIWRYTLKPWPTQTASGWAKLSMAYVFSPRISAFLQDKWGKCCTAYS